MSAYNWFQKKIDLLYLHTNKRGETVYYPYGKMISHGYLIPNKEREETLRKKLFLLTMLSWIFPIILLFVSQTISFFFSAMVIYILIVFALKTRLSTGLAKVQSDQVSDMTLSPKEIPSKLELFIILFFFVVFTLFMLLSSLLT